MKGLWFVVLSCYCFIICQCENSLETSVRSFFIGQDEEGTKISKFRSKNSASDFRCELKYKTKRDEGDGKDGKEEDKFDTLKQKNKGIQGMHRDVSTVLGKLSGVCIRKTIGYWKYELCFDSRITQSHGRDSFLLGTYTGMDGPKQLYTEGTNCGEIGRESRVEFICDSTLRIVSVEEVSTCSYKIYVTTPIVCGHPDFVQNLRSIPGMGKDKDSSLPPKDAWFLEISELDTGQIACYLSCINFCRTTTFEEFEFSLASSSHELKTEVEIIRGPARKSLSKKEKHYELVRTEEDTKIVMKHARNFPGRINHAMIQAVPTMTDV